MCAKLHYPLELRGRGIQACSVLLKKESSDPAGEGDNYVSKKCRKLVGFVCGERFIRRVQEQLPQRTQARKLKV